MKETKPTLPAVDWEKLAWEKTPYEGVFIHELEKELDPNNLDIPKYTVIALKLEPGAEIPLHIHKRKAGWTETITLPNGGWFETKSDQKSKKIKTENPFTIVIKAGEVFGLKNIHPSNPLYFYSKMKPGFTDYAEIEEIKQDADFQALKP